MFTLKFFSDKNTAHYFEVKEFEREWWPEEQKYRIRARLALGGSADFFVVGNNKVRPGNEFQVCYVLNENGKQVDRIGSGLGRTVRPSKADMVDFELPSKDGTSPQYADAVDVLAAVVNPRDASIIGGDPSQ